MTRRCIAAITIFFCWASACFATENLPEAQRALFLDFASDVSGGDPEVMQTARRIVETPPTTVEAIGFYGMTDAPPAERALRGIVSLLDARGHLVSVEDKYAYELAGTLAVHGVLPEIEPGSDLDVLGYFSGVDPNSGPTPEDWQSFRTWFPDHVRALEAEVAAAGHELMSLGLPLGDTLYYWAPAPEVAARWRGRAIYIGADTLEHSRKLLVTMSVGPPDWVAYWEFMTYAMQMPKPYQSVPEGLR